ncbi:uncharacterized protein DUF2790 [Pseudomonas duriflava]|uniref:Uncharacterized protein DUF2790 n=1 Tax=Pseudomonas duriflava TaxID=459528 RepID=A0A562QN17_9PSED|nr:DUF2790 domain-containing protein [Pseudomonas duriflava]TWI57456.1 uncharacterized protein DUF2790 [Pseudomonas duriflava]
MKRLTTLFAAACATLTVSLAHAAEHPVVEQYTYSTQLDIAKVIDLEQPADVCSVVPVHMTYEDHQGQRHTIEYSVMGTGCTNN